LDGPAFNDSSWAFGPAELGFGDGDEATMISQFDSSGSRLITAYFRHTFNVADVSAIAGLALRLWRDDGAIVYINGTEVLRDNMPSGPVNYATFNCHATVIHSRRLQWRQTWRCSVTPFMFRNKGRQNRGK